MWELRTTSGRVVGQSETIYRDESLTFRKHVAMRHRPAELLSFQPGAPAEHEGFLPPPDDAASKRTRCTTPRYRCSSRNVPATPCYTPASRRRIRGSLAGGPPTLSAWR